MKLSEKQKAVIKAMREGWELGKSTSSLSGRAWVQENGIGRGGKSIDMNIRTFLFLRNKQLISSKGYFFPVTRYELTELGKTIQL